MPELYLQSKTHSFSPEEKEFFLEPALTQRENIKDVLVSFSSDIVLPRSGLPSTSALSGLRLYFNGNDITAKFLARVVAALSSDPKARAGYKKGMQRWITSLGQIGIVEASEVAKQKALAATLGNAPWTTLITLGEPQKFGYQGALNPFFFFGREISIPRISLANILGAQDGLDALNVADWRTFVSNGTSSILLGGGAVTGASFRGVGTLALEYLYEDPWRIELLNSLQEISKNLANLSDQVTDIGQHAQGAYEKIQLIASLEKPLAESLQKLTALLPPPPTATKPL